MNKIVGCDILIYYPNFSEVYTTHTYTSTTNLRGVISQNGNTPAKINFTTTERELLSIVDNLKYFQTLLLGHHITVYMGHKNLTFETIHDIKSHTLAPYVGIIWPPYKIYQRSR